MYTKHRLAQYLDKSKLITDGSFGTYYSEKYDTGEMPELANTRADGRERVAAIHREYIEAGAGLIRTNTFASNTVLLNTSFDKVEENIKSAIITAKEAVIKASKAGQCFIAGDIGPVPAEAAADVQQLPEQYYQLGKTFVENGVDILTFETFSSLDDILPAIEKLKKEAAEKQQPLFIMVQFSVNQFGYSMAGLSAGKLLLQAQSIPQIDAVGLNCGVGPGHMQQIINSLPPIHDRFFVILPNAGYPKRIRNQIRFENNPEYFAQKTAEMSEKNNVDILGGCCGTTPEFIRLLSECFNAAQTRRNTKQKQETKQPRIEVRDCSFFAHKTKNKLIAVELAPPVTADDKKIMEAAYMLENLGVDVLTFPDSPSGRTRIDSVLMADKIHRETGMHVMPHICCRDKNAIAMRSVFLGAHVNDIHNFLIITGDPVPEMARRTIKPVFNFDAVGLMNIARDMNEENFADCPLTYGGAVNQSRKNLDVEIMRVKKKMAAGASFFMTQPIFTREDAERVRHIKTETGARILCGIMPLISRKNALFMKNEITGVTVTDEIVARYPENATKAEGEAVGISMACEIMEMVNDFADGYYFSFPFNRVYMLKQICERSSQYL